MGWLSLKVLESPKDGSPSGHHRVYISVPKKVVPRAVDRNRLKRLIREATREDIFFKRGRLFVFKVLSTREGLKLDAVKKAIELLKIEDAG